MKITLLTAASEAYWDVLSLTAPNKLEYCLRHKLQLSTRLHPTNLITDWGHREIIMLDELQSADWLFFMGSDTLICNMTIDIRAIIDECKEYDIVMAKDVLGINNDVMLIKNSTNSKCFLENTLFTRDVIDDQLAMAKHFDKADIRLVTQRLFNSYPSWEYARPTPEGETFQLGDFVLHLPGIPNARRIEIINEYLPKVIR